MAETPQPKKLLLVGLVIIVLLLSALVSLKLDFDNRDMLFQSIIRENPDGMEAFRELSEVTPPDAVIFSWWDYGRAIEELGARRAVVAYPSRDISQSIAASQNPVYALEMMLFGSYESSEKIRDVARAFLLSENESLRIMRKYGATHVMVFHGKDDRGAFNDVQKFYWIARIAGHNGSEYIRIDGTSPKLSYELTPKAEQATMLRLLFDENFSPQHFRKIYENAVTKIYRIVYPTFTGSPSQSGSEPCWIHVREQLVTASLAQRATYTLL